MAMPVQQFQIEQFSPDTLASHLLNAFKSGMDISHDYREFEPQLKQEQLKQAILEKQLPYIEQQQKADIANKNADAVSAGLKNKYPLLFSNNATVTGQGALQYLLENPGNQSGVSKGQSPSTQEQPSAYDNLQNALLNQQRKQSSWRALPAIQKNQLVNEITRFGYNPNEAAKLLDNNVSVQSMATSKGYKQDGSDWPAINEPKTQATVTTQQRQAAANIAIHVTKPMVDEALSPYAGKIDGFSPTLNLDLLGGDKDQDRAGDALGAMAYSWEQAGEQAKQAGLTGIGVSVIEHLKNGSYGDLKTFGVNLSERAFLRAQRKLQQLTTINANSQLDFYKKLGMPGVDAYKTPEITSAYDKKYTNLPAPDYSKYSTEQLQQYAGQ